MNASRRSLWIVKGGSESKCSVLSQTINHTAPSAGGPFRAVTSWWSTSSESGSLSLLHPLVFRTSMSSDRYRLSELLSTRVVWPTHLSDPISAQQGEVTIAGMPIRVPQALLSNCSRLAETFRGATCSNSQQPIVRVRWSLTFMLWMTILTTAVQHTLRGTVLTACVPVTTPFGATV